MNLFKRFLLALLGERRYLALLAGSFQYFYKTVQLGKSYQDIYFLKELVVPGNYLVDIGAHLGYYTVEMSRLTGDAGRVYAIEPMTKFNSVLENLIKKKKLTNVSLYKVALGGTGEYVTMGIPKLGIMKKFAYARVMESSKHLKYSESEKVKNETGDHLFEGLPGLDFIKCDVEGFELPVFLSMMETIKKHFPILLCELADRNERIRLYELLLPLGYQAYLLSDNKLYLLDVYSEIKAISHNHYFIPIKHEQRLKKLINDD
jgi:FkbM family methyltransferase